MIEMKDSGYFWIGKIPKAWEATPIKYLLTSEHDSIKVGPFGSQLSGSDFTDEGYWVYNQRSVIDKNFSGNTVFISQEKFEAMRGFHVRSGDILITTRGTIGRICQVPATFEQGIIHPCIIKFRVDETRINYEFLERVINDSDLVRTQLLYKSNATTIDVIYSETLKNIVIPIPPMDIQLKIVDYLRPNCAELDNIIAKTRASIEEYKKLKQAVITRAVTKGIHGDRKLVPSGIRWIQELPEGWKSINPKALFTQRKDKALEGERQLTASQQYGVIYQDNYMEITGNKIVTVEKDFSILKHVEAGDFVISMRSFQGGLEYSENTGSISSAYVMLIPNLEKVYPRFYKWLFKSSIYINALQSTSDLVRDGQAMRFSNFSQVKLYEIPMKEQQKIADYLDVKCAEIDRLIAKKEQYHVEIENYKKSLIYEFVTGKKEVP